MANRLNVLVGATLEQNVEKTLNSEIAKLNLNALELQAKFDNNFQDVVDNIKKAIAAVDFSKINNGFGVASQAISGIGAGFNNVTGFIDKANKAVIDLDGNLKSASHTIQNLDGTEITAKIKYDKDGNEVGEISWDDKSAEKHRKEAEAQAKKDEQARLAYQKKVVDKQKEAVKVIQEQNAYMKQNYALTEDELAAMDKRQREVNILGANAKNESADMKKLVGYNNQINDYLQSSNELMKKYSTYVPKLSIDSAKEEYIDFRNQIDHTIKQIDILDDSVDKNALLKYFGNLRKEVDKYIERLDEAGFTQKKFDNDQEKFGSTSSNFNLAGKWFNEFAKMQDKLNSEVASMQKKYGTDFDEAEFREIYNINNLVLGLLKQQGTEWKDIELEIDKVAEKAKNYKSNLALKIDKNVARDYLSDITSKLSKISPTVDIGIGFDSEDFKVYKYIDNELTDISRILSDSKSTTEDIIKATQRLVDVEELLEKTADNVNEKRKESNKLVAEQANRDFDVYQKNLKANSLANAELKKTDDLYNKVHIKVKELKGSYSNILGETNQFESFEKELEEIISDMTKYSNSAEVMTKSQERLNMVMKDATSADKVNSMLVAFNAETEREVVKLNAQYGAAFNEADYRKRRNLEKEISDIIKTQGYNLNACNKAKLKLISSSKDFTTNLSASAKELKKIEEKAELLNTSLGRFIQFYGFGQAFGAVKHAAIDMFEQIKLVDSSMVELKKVTNETSRTYDKFLNNSAEKAKEFGVTMTDYIDSVTNFARMDVGGFAAAQEVAEVANIFQQVSENLTADQASEYLISNMKAWGYEANNAIEIVDVLNNLSNKYAITIDGLGESLTRSSAAMKSANNTLEQTAALTIAANNVIQDPLTVGNALKTVSIDKLVA